MTKLGCHLPPWTYLGCLVLASRSSPLLEVTGCHPLLQQLAQQSSRSRQHHSHTTALTRPAVATQVRRLLQEAASLTPWS